jgi:hypothetical protein
MNRDTFNIPFYLLPLVFELSKAFFSQPTLGYLRNVNMANIKRSREGSRTNFNIHVNGNDENLSTDQKLYACAVCFTASRYSPMDFLLKQIAIFTELFSIRFSFAKRPRLFLVHPEIYRIMNHI